MKYLRKLCLYIFIILTVLTLSLTVAFAAQCQPYHKFETVTTPASWKHDGKTVEKCKVCGLETNTEIINAPYLITLENAESSSVTDLPAFKYTGKEIKPKVQVLAERKGNLKEGTDYTVSYEDNIKIGVAQVTIKFKGKYKGSQIQQFVIYPSEPKNIVATFDSQNATVTWKAVPGATGYVVKLYKNGVLMRRETVKENKIVIDSLDSSALYGGNIVCKSPMGNSKSGYFRFTTPEIEFNSTVYNGKEQKPEITLKDDEGNKLAENVDYSVSYSDSKDVGVATATIRVMSAPNLPPELKMTETLKVNYNILPQKVTGLKTVTAKTTSLSLNWSKVTGAEKYLIYQSTDGKKWSKVASSVKNSITVNSLTAGQKYQYKVRASAESGYGEYSSAHKTQSLTTAPKSLSVSAVSKSAIKLSWKSVFGATGYIVYQSTDGKAWSKAAVLNTNTTTVKSLKTGGKYQFKIVSVSMNGNSAYSDVLKTQTLTASPELNLTSSKSKTVTASWKKVSGASKYIVYKSPDGKNWSKAVTTTDLKFDLSKLTGGKKIYVKVVAVNSYGKNSASSPVKSITVKK